MGDKIEPCPWCGSPASLIVDCAERTVLCEQIECLASGPRRTTGTAAISAWNEAAGLRAEVERLKADLATARELYTATCDARSNPWGVGFPAEPRKHGR